jgi:hypothetical protein
MDVYFSLIHARTAHPNQWVHRFYRLLDEEVRGRAEPIGGLRVGSLYFDTEAAAQQALTTELPGARVLIPLYTREFLHDPPPDFAPYLDGRPEPTRVPFLHPVMWDSYPPPRGIAGIAQARSLGATVSAYEECGMGSICRLNAFAQELKQLIDLLADRVVRAAQHPERIPDWSNAEPIASVAPSGEAPFLVSVVRRSGQGTGWNPFGADRGSLADLAVDAARRLVLLPEVTDHLPASDADGAWNAPGIVLVDLWALDDPTTRPAAKQLLLRPPPWTTIVLVVDQRHPDHNRRGRLLVDEAISLVGPGVQIARSAPEFDRVIEEAIQRTRRNFLRGRASRPLADG